MTTYYYLDDADSEFGYTPVPEEEYVMAIFKITEKQGIKITDEMILSEIKKGWKKDNKKSL